MNILILNWRDPKNPKSGGAEKVTLEHAKAWLRAGYSVDWIASSFKNCKKKEVLDGIMIYRPTKPIFLFLVIPLVYIFSHKKYDLVVDEIHGLPFLTPLFVKQKKLAFIHEVAGDIWDDMFPFPFNKLGRWLEQYTLILYKKTRFLTGSNSTKEELMNLGIKDITIIHHGYNNFALLKNKKEQLPTFIFVSRLVKMKGIEDILLAFKLIKEMNNNAQLWVVGEGSKGYTSFLKKLAKNYKINTNTTFFGKVIEGKKYELMSRAHILLHASTKEGWGLVVIEAASQKTPSVVYDVAGLRDSVINGKTGVVLKDSRPDEMAKAALLLYNNEEQYKKFQDQCIQWSNNFSWDKMSNESVLFINRIISTDDKQ